MWVKMRRWWGLGGEVTQVRGRGMGTSSGGLAVDLVFYIAYLEKHNDLPYRMRNLAMQICNPHDSTSDSTENCSARREGGVRPSSVSMGSGESRAQDEPHLRPST